MRETAEIMLSINKVAPKSRNLSFFNKKPPRKRREDESRAKYMGIAFLSGSGITAPATTGSI
jgi:hypothetical protein